MGRIYVPSFRLFYFAGNRFLDVGRGKGTREINLWWLESNRTTLGGESDGEMRLSCYDCVFLYFCPELRVLLSGLALVWLISVTVMIGIPCKQRY